jgi:hypothetical protein
MRDLDWASHLWGGVVCVALRLLSEEQLGMLSKFGGTEWVLLCCFGPNFLTSYPTCWSQLVGVIMESM